MMLRPVTRLVNALTTSDGAQWMTAGRGIVHSEMPLQKQGRMRGFQLWINLPAREKMRPPAYRDLAPDAIPEVRLEGGGRARVLAGAVATAAAGGEAGAGEMVSGPIEGVTTRPVFLDITLAAGERCELPLDAGHNACVYVYDGSIEVGLGHTLVSSQQAALLGAGEAVAAMASRGAAGFLLLAARPLGEPVVQYGPFVMNTREEIEQALADYQTGRLVQGT